MLPLRWRRAVCVALVLVPLSAGAADAPAAPSFADAGPHSIRDGDRLGIIDRTGRVVPAPGFDELKLGDGLVTARGRHRVACCDAGGNAAWSKP